MSTQQLFKFIINDQISILKIERLAVAAVLGRRESSKKFKTGKEALIDAFGLGGGFTHDIGNFWLVSYKTYGGGIRLWGSDILGRHINYDIPFSRCCKIADSLLKQTTHEKI